MNELTSFALSQGSSAVNGIFLRGGVDFGLWYRNKDRLISPALVKAYNLEHQACVPMIALTDEIYSHFSEHSHRQFYSKSFDPVPKILRRFEDLPNGTGQWFIDYVPICLESLDGHIAASEMAAYRAADSDTRQLMRNEAFGRDCHQWAVWHADAIRAQHRAAMTDSVRAKYVWLATYHDDAMHRFFHEPPPDTLIGDMASVKEGRVPETQLT